MKYAVKVENDLSVEAIVGDADWAVANLGGHWVPSETKVGTGWVWDGHQFHPPSEPEVEQ